MENEINKVFSSSIIRSRKRSFNDYKDILNVVPATPIPNQPINIKSCDYRPRNDKIYIPKKKIGSKVKTVRDIRAVFEKDVYSNLIPDIEKQHDFLLRKIRLGHSKNTKTKEIAKKLLNSDSPISKSIWQMLMNINPEDNVYPIQFVIWNGNQIKINGSKGGRHKLIFKNDLSKINNPSKKNCLVQFNTFIQKQSLINNSLHVRFKPGPLRKKKYLDVSYQKHIGDVGLITLPRAGLEIEPSYGKPIAPSISALLYNTFSKESSSKISEEWANFAISVLGYNVNGRAIQSSKDLNSTFQLNYKGLQTRLLMRHDSDMIYEKEVLNSNLRNEVVEGEFLINQVSNVLNDLLKAVEISLEQDNMYSGEDELRDTLEDNNYVDVPPKEKVKKKFCELNRLDVTVIRISEKEDNTTKICSNLYCNFGCICDSLSCRYKFKGHCGRVECMFQCKCVNFKQEISDFLEKDYLKFLPEIINNENNLNMNLAKEEKMFHQTVILTDEKSIVLKSKKRNWKASKKYGDFYNHMRLKSSKKPEKLLSVVATKINCNNIEPLCLVHNLYRCFCRGKYLESIITSIEETKTVDRSQSSLEMLLPINIDNSAKTTNLVKTATSSYSQIDRKVINTKGKQYSQNILDEGNVKSLRIRSRLINQKQEEEKSTSESDSVVDSEKQMQDIFTCARIKEFEGRKYSNKYYLACNEKIKSMEKNDKTLQKKLIYLMKLCDTTEQITVDNVAPSPSLREILLSVAEDSCDIPQVVTANKSRVIGPLDNKCLPNKSKLVAWLESSYKQYKLKADQGIMKTCLGPPQEGKLALYPWEFILGRYEERKNYFLVSCNKPIRLFMAVSEKNSYFESCININNIPSTDVYKYPITVQNLLKHATNLPDNFCILHGLSHCWEIIGSVTKINERAVNCTDMEISDLENSDVSKEFVDFGGLYPTQEEYIHIEDDNDRHLVSDFDISKWFVMTVENDFTEIQFYKKGFFVKHDSLMKAIKVARVSGKTVRLSSQKCVKEQSDPQFGIYATPKENDNCVFIGPFKKEEKLDIDILKLANDTIYKFTRGVWITTKKIDNHRVIDNPLSFIPVGASSDKIIALDSYRKEKKSPQHVLIDEDKNKQTFVKTLKPIKIQKANSFYVLSPNGQLKPITQTKISVDNNRIDKQKPTSLRSVNDILCSKSLDQSSSDDSVSSENSFRVRNKIKFANKPVAEIAPQIKTSVSDKLKRKQGGMFILKPEEINKKSMEGSISEVPNIDVNNTSCDDLVMEDKDVESFLLTYSIKPPPKTDIYIISDDETDFVTNYKNEYIICKNIKNLGWIQGRRNFEDLLSFEFPGFKETEFYSETEAYEKINQVFSRKVYVPKHITLEWCTSDNLSDVATKQKLTLADLSSDYIMTKNGLQNKKALLNYILSKGTPEPSGVLPSTSQEFMKEKNNILKELQERSDALEKEGEILWNETMLKRDKLCESFSDANDDVREGLSSMLNEILSDTSQEDN